jgi:hypothetical protein
MDPLLPLRFPTAPEREALYESVYAVVAHPREPQALWVRTTVRKRAGEAPTGALWVTWFGPDGVRAGKVDPLPVAPASEGIAVGEARQGPASSRGSIDLPTLRASWDLALDRRSPALQHLRPGWLYGAPLPRTKATSPAPEVAVSGALAVDGAEVDVAGWTGMVGHNWGSEHAARWIWLRAGGLGDDGRGWLDAVLGRVRVAGRLTPWSGFGAVELDGARLPLGGLLRRGTSVELGPSGAQVVLRGPGVEVRTRASAALPSTVGWSYADPAGARHEVVNCSVATMEVELLRGGERTRWWPEQRGVLEVGGDSRAFDVPLQPYPD